MIGARAGDCIYCGSVVNFEAEVVKDTVISRYVAYQVAMPEYTLKATPIIFLHPACAARLGEWLLRRAEETGYVHEPS